MFRKLNSGTGKLDDPAVGNKKGVVFIYSDYTPASYPEDVVNHRHVIVHEELPENMWRGSELHLYVMKVVSPSEFWINLYGLEYSRKLFTLRANMRKFYEQADDKYRLPSYALRFGHFCVCLYRNEWHRARIVKTDEKGANLVDVFLVDCGSTVTASTENLRFMHKTFSYLPIQSFQADLPDIKPKGSAAWTTSACQFFREETSGKKLRAKLVDLFRERHAVSLKLFDVNGKSISEKLISNVMAEAVAEDTGPPPAKYEETVDARNKECLDSGDKELVDSSGDASSVEAENVAISEDTSPSTREDSVPEDETASSSVDAPASWRNVDHKYVTIVGKTVLLVTIKGKKYFVLSDFLRAFALFHEHVVLKLLETFPTQVVVEKMVCAELRMLLSSLRVGRIRHLMDNGIVPSVNLLPVNVACQLLTFLGEDDTQTLYLKKFVSSLV